MTKRRPDPKTDPVPQAPGKPPANETDVYDRISDYLQRARHNPELRFR